MVENPLDIYSRWKLAECMSRHPRLRITPSTDGELLLNGEIDVNVTGPDGTTILDTFQIEVEIPHSFPSRPAYARETGGRIPEEYHKLKGNWLCLGSPTAIRLMLIRHPDITGFVEKLVIPYLFGYAYFEKTGKMPFGELDHGAKGLLQHFADLFGLASHDAAKKMVILAALQKRVANKYPCPCRSGRRLGRCHHLVVNRYRNQLTRKWFRSQLAGSLLNDLKP